MAIIIVGGSAKGVGKTTLVCGLIAALDELRWTAVKITSEAHEGLPPIFEEKTAGPETDTARYLAAGAERAFLLTVPAERDLAEALNEFWRRIGRGTNLIRGANLIFESNRAMNCVSADVRLVVHRGQAEAQTRPKPSFFAAMRFADALVARGDEDRVFRDAINVANREPKPIFHLKNLDCISAEMKKWLRDLPGLMP
ncbi:MAG: hypothetical protein ACLQHF_12850 [Terracidiphilus sp.]